MNLRLVALLAASILAIAACSDSSSSSAEGNGGTGGAAGSGASVAPGGSCKNAKECACWKCDCGNGMQGSNYGCVGSKCITGEAACEQACGLTGADASAATHEEDPSGVACGWNTGGSGGAAGSGGGGTKFCYDPATIDCAVSCTWLLAHCNEPACASTSCSSPNDCELACNVTKASTPEVNAQWGCAQPNISCPQWRSCLKNTCN